MNKGFSKKLYLFLVFMCGLLLFIPNQVIAATNVIQMEHKTNVPVDKVWQIKFNQPINPDKLSDKVVVWNPIGIKVQTKISYDSINNAITVEPPALGYICGQTYSLQIYETIKDLNANPLKTAVTMSFTIEAPDNRPQISNINMDHSPLIQGENAKFYIASKAANKVQYRVYVKKQQSNTYKELTNGYSEVMEGTGPFNISSSEAFDIGGYELKVYVKKANVKGMNIDSNTDYDDFKVYEFQCLTKDDLRSNYVVEDTITDATRYKIGQVINIDQNLGQANSPTTTLKAYKLFKEEVEDLTSNTTWIPNEVGMYRLEATTKSLNGSTGQYVVSTKTKYIEVYNKEYNNEKYDKALNEIVDMQSKVNPVNAVPKYTLNASNEDVYEYMNPKNFEEHDYGIYQFLTLNYIDGITVEDVDNILKGEGILEGQGKTFLDSCKKYNVNIAYIISHAILETGHGKSDLANGIDVTEVGGNKVEKRTTYNMFGIGAWDENPLKLGSERAYKEEWFSVEAAIAGGIKYISEGYINNESYKQNTLYKMRWNPAKPATHQYATDIGWAYKQSYRIKEILDKCKNAYLVFEIPQYK